jgi:plastocyanin
MKATTPLKVAVSILNFLSVSSFVFAFLISTNDSNILNVQGQGYVNATIVLDSSTLGNKSYKPNPIEIPVGNSIVWTNGDFVSHSVTAIKGEFDSNILYAGKVFKHNFDEVGVYDYYCMLHPSMVGRILVAK